MAKILSNIGYTLPIEKVSRKFARRVDTASSKVASTNNTGLGVRTIKLPVRSWMGASSKEVNIFGYGIHTRNSFIVRTKGRSTVALADELAARAAFTKASKWVTAAMKDLMAINANQSRFLNATADLSKRVKGVSAQGYQTMRGWMFAIAIAIQNASETLPNDHLIPDFDA